MRRISIADLAAIVLNLHELVEQELQLVLVGGTGVMALTPTVHPTQDIDVLWSDSLLAARTALGEKRWNQFCKEAQLSTRSDPFEVLLPSDWRKRKVQSPLSTTRVRVVTPCPEDLASMKVFRLLARDADDIQALAALPDFAPKLFKRSFCATLPFAIGRSRWHVQSFCMVWNGLYPDTPLESSDIFALAGLAPS